MTPWDQASFDYFCRSFRQFGFDLRVDEGLVWPDGRSAVQLHEDGLMVSSTDEPPEVAFFERKSYMYGILMWLEALDQLRKWRDLGYQVPQIEEKP